MIAAELTEPDDFDAWRDLARSLAASGIAPKDIAWRDAGAAQDLFAGAGSVPANGPACREIRVSKAFLDLARTVILHREETRLDLLYRVLWRLQERPRLIEDPADPDVRTLHHLAKQVRQDIHKMRAFVRFRSLGEPGGAERFVAWFEPEHRIERRNARFFLDRFASQHWSILTPRISLHWDGEALHEGPAARREDAPSEDATEALWVGYYRSIFNPARLKVGAMTREMPRKYWKNLPEARAIRDLVAGAQAREAKMIASGADRFEDAIPSTLDELASGISSCRRCAIGCNGTRAVPGSGLNGGIMILGEQPGDTEEREGVPFAGPAGQLLDRALKDAGIVRDRAYVTNAVKHFKFSWRGNRRLHQNPAASEIDTCRWWLDAERALVRPAAILALGASAGRALLGRTPAVGRERGTALSAPDGTPLWLTVHPSYLLRLDGPSREREEARFREDLAEFARRFAQTPEPSRSCQPSAPAAQNWRASVSLHNRRQCAPG